MFKKTSKILLLVLLVITLSYVQAQSKKDSSAVQSKSTSILINSEHVNVSITGDTTKNIKKDSTIISSSKELTPPSISDIISFGKIFWALVFFIIGYYIIRLLTKVLDIFAEKSTGYRITIKGFVPILRIFGWVLIIYIIIAGIFKPPIATIIAVTASVGIAIGFAAQDIFKNIFGGIMILFDRPFQVGDKIAVDDHYGEVVKIGLRSTRIVTADDSLVTLPNGEIMNQPVSNSNSGEPNCQVVAEIYLPISVDTDRVREIATESCPNFTICLSK